MKTAELNYRLPPELIAQHPPERRDASRLLVYDRASGAVRHRVFSELPDELHGELVVVNDTRVLPARIPIEKPRGEVLLLERGEDGLWEGLARPTKQLRAGARYGDVELLARLDVERVTLHVGLDTFRPVTVKDLDAHVLHGERYEVRPEAWERVRKAERVLAVGTTTVRVLESLTRGALLLGRTALFIRPGFEFRRVDALLTNFHLPRSTLLALVMAFTGVEETRRLYELAIAERYRFYSFGDAMLVLRASSPSPPPTALRARGCCAPRTATCRHLPSCPSARRGRSKACTRTSSKRSALRFFWATRTTCTSAPART